MRQRNDAPRPTIDALSMTSSQRVTANDTVEQFLTKPGAVRVLVDCGMHCVGCAVAPFETVAEACAIYGVSVDELFAALDRSAEAEGTDNP